MEESYQIGGHQFATKEEYEVACKDYEYIKQFMNKLDLKKPEIAKKLYLKVKDSNTLLATSIGEAFKEKLVQIFVTSKVQEMKERLEKEETMSFRELYRRITKPILLKVYGIGMMIETLLMFLYGILKGLLYFSLIKVNHTLTSIVKYAKIGGIHMGYLLMVATIAYLLYDCIEKTRKKMVLQRQMEYLFVSGVIVCLYYSLFSMA